MVAQVFQLQRGFTDTTAHGHDWPIWRGTLEAKASRSLNKQAISAYKVRRLALARSSIIAALPPHVATPGRLGMQGIGAKKQAMQIQFLYKCERRGVFVAFPSQRSLCDHVLGLQIVERQRRLCLFALSPAMTAAEGFAIQRLLAQHRCSRFGSLGYCELCQT